jgi:hypothetical protein
VSKLYEVAILYHDKPTKAEEEQGKRPKTTVIKDVIRLVAKDEREALLTAARDIPVEYIDKLESVEVLIRPF